MGFLNNLQKKFGKYAIHNLTRYIIATYIIGYIISLIGSSTGNSIIYYLTLNPALILQGQIWRLFTWILIPPTTISIFTVIMLICYYQLGTILEKVWGDFYYNVYIFLGLIMTVIGTFVMYFIPYTSIVMTLTQGQLITTYYVSLSIFLGFAMTFPEQQMLFMFIIPIRIKWLALVDVAYLVYVIVTAFRSSVPALGIIVLVEIICSLASTILFIVMFGRAKRQAKKRADNFKKAAESPQAKKMQAKGYIHKCYICGQTEKDDPNLVFRYCSKCNGGYEYCQNHLFTHTHIQ